MTIRARTTLWYAGILLVSGILIALLTWDEFRERPRTRRSEEGMEEVTDIFVWVGLPAALLSVAGGWWLMRKSLAPVTTLTEAAEHITASNLGDQLPRTGNGDELDRLSEVLNRMTGRLNDSFRRIHEFTLHASHELKTPLTILCGEAEIALRDESLTSEERERAVSQLDELRRLTRIVDGLTLLAKADAGLIPLVREPVCLDELVRDIFADTQILALASGLRVELTACEPITMNGDAHRLRQLLLNLADNAVKYNQPQGSITMSLRRAGNEAEFTTANAGAGIPQASVARVFDRFYRCDPAHSSNVEGCGLGLSIAQWIVSAHKGTIQIESMPAKLTTIIVRLPLT